MTTNSNHHSPPVSVIITCFNLQAYIAGAIQSVFDQDYCGDIEVLVVDDASTDTSVSVIRQFEPIRLFVNSSNRGVFYSTVFALSHVSHDYVFFLDADDYWHPEKISRCMKMFLSNDNIALVTHDVVFIDKYSRPINKSTAYSQSLASSSASERAKDLILRQDDIWLGSAYSIRTSRSQISSLLDWAHTLINASTLYQDWPLAFWILTQPNVDVGYINQQLMSYRIHGLNYSADTSSLSAALATVRKVRDTAFQLHSITSLRLPGSPYSEIARSKYIFYSYLWHIYQKRSIRAIHLFVSSQLFLFRPERIFVKEWLRFLGLLFFGPKSYFSFLLKLRSLSSLLP